jgi:hypothetical protein
MSKQSQHPNLPAASEVELMVVGKPFRLEAELAGAGSSKGMGYWWRLKLPDQDDWQLGMDTIMADRHPRLLLYAVVLADTDEEPQHDALNRVFVRDLQEQAEMEGRAEPEIERLTEPAAKAKGPYNEFWVYLFRYWQPQNYPKFQELIRREADLPADWPTDKKPNPRKVLHDAFGVESMSYVHPADFNAWLRERRGLDRTIESWISDADEKTRHTWANVDAVTEVNGGGEKDSGNSRAAAV